MARLARHQGVGKFLNIPCGRTTRIRTLTHLVLKSPAPVLEEKVWPQRVFKNLSSSELSLGLIGWVISGAGVAVALIRNEA